MHSHLILPHGGMLLNLIVNQERAEELKRLSRDWPSWDLTPRQLCDLELLANGGFSPLRGFLWVKIRARGGNYLLNVGPKPNGELPAPQVELLKKLGS